MVLKNSKSSPIGIGVISIITVLLVLTLSVFSVLTLVSARSDLELSERNAQTISAYYKADNEANKIYDNFVNSEETELITEVVVSERQTLYLHLIKNDDGNTEILEWRTIPVMVDGFDGTSDLEVFMQ